MTTNFQTEAEPLRVGTELTIPRAELVLRASRAGGPGGQHVNTSSTRIELLWNVRGSAALTDRTRARLEQRLAKRIDSAGWLRVVASESRSQLRNRKLAEERLVKMVRSALVVPKPRKRTAPTRASREQRLNAKKRHSDKKQLRRGDYE